MYMYDSCFELFLCYEIKINCATPISILCVLMEIYTEWYGEYRRQYATVLTYCKLPPQGIRPGLINLHKGF